jgi:hypothetical protein
MSDKREFDLLPPEWSAWWLTLFFRVWFFFDRR